MLNQSVKMLFQLTNHFSVSFYFQRWIQQPVKTSAGISVELTTTTTEFAVAREESNNVVKTSGYGG